MERHAVKYLYDIGQGKIEVSFRDGAVGRYDLMDIPPQIKKACVQVALTKGLDDGDFTLYQFFKEREE